ncbi:MAG: type II toxin-antitoxin system Txe/YoeB family toxin [Candidatus Paraimprobicoccus trichonymphae]|uniref:Endoribonuclease YoeB n=1 Tax=Candidatus Paraimprobicoccus trichonymphae TaxID=3033793 RepID=A0AA48HWY9_9FIRM|nr:MAG: type II toxin-antitoxin system Txe/YoeB family toxin [Candidatus Paraimprobicoccus trichonymphae]
MVKNFRIKYSKQAIKDIKNLKSANLDSKAKKLITILKGNPYQNPPPYEKLTGDLNGMCSRRINIQHRLVYQICIDEKIVKILRMWKHYK